MIYLDHAALTPVVPEALDAMVAATRDAWGNPNSVHHAGRRSRAALERARIQVAEYLGASPPEVSWEAGASAALGRALSFAIGTTQGPLVCGALEHPSVRESFERALLAGREVRWLPQPAGELDVEAAARMLPDAAVVALSAMNHELGTTPALDTLFPLAPAAWWIVDAAQAAAWLRPSAWLTPRTFVICSSSKLGGPPGVAALRTPPHAALSALERAPWGLPRGTPPWVAAVGMGAACAARAERLANGALSDAMALAHRLLTALHEACDGLLVNAGPSRLGPILNCGTPKLDGARAESALDLAGVCIARTAACRQHLADESTVVREAYPLEPWRARAATRWSVGLDTTPEDIDAAAHAWAAVLQRAPVPSGAA